MSLTLRLDLTVLDATAVITTVSFRDKATLDDIIARFVGNGAAEERPSMFNEVDVSVLMP
jgi:hypothetical protein